MKKKLLITCTVGGLLLASFLTTSVAKADNSATDSITVQIPMSCTLRSVIATGEEHTVSLVSGQYRDNIGKTTITTYCNDTNGFDIYAVGASDNQEGKTYLSSSAGSNYNIPTGVHTSGSSASSWAMKLGLIEGRNYNPTPVTGMFGSYIAVPNEWTKVAYRDASAGNMSMDFDTGGSAFTTTYEVNTNSAQPAGTYTGAVKYVVLHPDVQVRPTLTTLEDAFDTVVGVNNKVTYNGQQYYRMQDMTASICAQTDIVGGGSQLQLLDDRTNADGTKRVYWVAKLDDGNCWMTQNLDLDWEAGKTFTHYDTDLGWNGTIDTTASWTVGSGYGTIAWDSEASAFTGWSDDNNHPYSADPGEKYYYASNGTGYDVTFDTMQQCLNADHTKHDCEHYSAGNYYNWTAAVATNDSSNITSGDAPNSICPAGWRLPSSLMNEFAQLLIDYDIIAYSSATSYMTGGFNIIRSSPLYFARAGYVYISGGTGSRSDAANLGLYWSKTAKSVSRIGVLRIANSLIVSARDEFRNRGWSVRCMAR